MKLRNKKTGETGYYLHTHRDHRTGVLKVAVLKDGVPFSEFKPYEPIYDYDSLTELNEEWEDYKEPKKTWFIDTYGSVRDRTMTLVVGWDNKPIFEFETKEEAEEAAEKIKAWKRLKDKGFSFNDWDWKYQNIGYNLDCTAISEEDVIEAEKDLDLLFGGEE